MTIKRIIKDRSLEIISGIAVIIVILVFVSYGINVYFASIVGKYNVNAVFNNVGPLTKGSKIKINGFTVGKVKDIILHHTNYSINVVLEVDSDIKIPTTSVVAIYSSGFLEAPYLNIEIGKDNNTYLSNNDTVINTKGFISLDEKIGGLFLNFTSK